MNAHLFPLLLGLAIVFFPAGQLVADDSKTLKSGPQVGEAAVPYHPLLCNGNAVGQRWCMVCTHRSQSKASVIVFAREDSKAVTDLLVAIDGITKKASKPTAGIFTYLTTKGKSAAEAEALTGKKVVYINDHEKQQFTSLSKLAQSGKIKNSNLNIYTTDGPAGYGLSKDAALTILITNKAARVVENIALSKSGLGKEKIAETLQKIKAALQN